MSRKLGFAMMVLGILMLFASGIWQYYNYREDQKAGMLAESRLSLLVHQISVQQTEATEPDQDAQESSAETLWIPEETLPPQEEQEPTEPTMPDMEVDGETYIGYISMPDIKIELPVMSNWNYDKLLRSPCYYYGTVDTGNLVLMAHNYTRHFGKLSLLAMGDRVTFVDINGEATEYEVVYRETLPPTCIPELTDGTYDLTLFTCTYSGANRIVVRCNQIRSDS